MKKRSLIKMLILSIVTLGIYNLYWLIVTRRELNSKTDAKIPTIWIIIAPIIVILIGYIFLFGSILTSKSTTSSSTSSSSSFSYNYSTNFSSTNSSSTTGSQTTNLNSSKLGISFVIGIGLTSIGFIAAFVLAGVWFFKYSKGVEKYTSGKMSTAVTFLLLWLVHLIGVLLVQNVFNEMLNAPNGPSLGSSPNNGSGGNTNSLPPNNQNQTPVNNINQPSPLQPPVSVLGGSNNQQNN